MNNQDLILPIKFTKNAIIKIKKIISNKKDPNIKLRIYIVGGGCNGFQYKFILDNQICENDTIIKKKALF